MTAVAYVNSSISSFATASSKTISTTVAAGTNCLIALVHASGTITTTGITYNSVAFTKLGQVETTSNKRHVEIWYLLNPTVTTANLVASYSGSVLTAVGIVHLSGVKDVTGFNSATGASATPSVNITSKTDALVVDGVAAEYAATALACHVSQTSHYSVAEGTTSKHGSSREAGAASVTMSWSMANDQWAICGGSFNPIILAGGSQIIDYGDI